MVAGNLITNGRFEGPPTSGGTPEAWDPGGMVSFAAEPLARSGRAVRIELQETGRPAGLWSRHHPKVKPLTTYTLTVRAMFDGTDDKGRLNARPGQMLGGLLIAPHEAPRSGGFKTFRMSFTTGPSVDTLWRPQVFIEDLRGAVYLEEIRLEEGGEPGAAGPDKPVPADRLLPVRHRLAAPSLDAIRGRFERLHEESERAYRGAGQWEGYCDLTEGWRQAQADPPDWSFTKHPLLRSTTQRIFGYLGAHSVTGRDVYLQRAREGIEYVLAEQQPDGSFLGYFTETGAYHKKEYYESGLAGAALAESYLQLGDGRCLEAARRVAEYALRIKASLNVNYNMFLIWAASRYAAASGDLSLLLPITDTDKLLFTLNSQYAWGGWHGHNSKMCYHAINLRGMVALYDALPKDRRHDALLLRLKQASIAAVNRMIVEQRPDGGLAMDRGKPETARAFGAYVPTLIMVHDVLGLDTTGLLDGLMHFYDTPQARGDIPHWMVLGLLQSDGVYLDWKNPT